VAKSPGMKYRHYSPRSRVIILSKPVKIRSRVSAAYIGMELQGDTKEFRLHRICENVEEYAHELFEFFRLCDEANVSVIYCQSVEPKGLGLALMDRLKRASQ
jgi:L-threonylcarbamoyladenylate synthase